MCFSPEASFAGGIVISSIGVAAIKKVQKPSHIVFASIPLFFGVQQIAEGFVWLALSNPEYANAQKIGTYVFLFMARVLWPMMMPLSVLLMEEHHKRKKILLILLAMGSSVSLYYSYCLLFLNVTPQIMGYHIQYQSDYPESLAVLVFVIYFIAAITPLFVSSIKRTRLLGVLMFLSCLVTAIFFVQYLTSVWCFFAALISGVIFWILSEPIHNSNSETLQAEMGLQ
jgi:hypothetical protein